jgi:opacity protein-like surface antigen
MKKLVLAVICLFILVFGISAIEVSAGVGGDVAFIFTSTDTNIPQPYKSQLITAFDDVDMTRWGISAFFDAQYIEANIGFKFLTSSYSGSDYKYEETDNFFNIGLKLKYPFKITESIRIFPLIGFDYSIFDRGKATYDGQIYIVYNRDNLILSDALDGFSLNLGVGGDFFISGNVYIRCEYNYSFFLNTETQKETIETIESSGYNLSIFQNGPMFMLAVGYRFLNN